MAQRKSRKPRRRGTLLTLAALMMTVLLSLIACAIDVGYTAIIRTHLQATADSAALASVGDLPFPGPVRTTALQYANLNTTSNGPLVTNGSIELGIWDSSNRSFTPNENVANAVRVTSMRTAANGNPLRLFFAPVMGVSQLNVTASSIAVARPRDIAFVIDLSGSMNNDSEPWATAGLNTQFPGYPTIGTELMQQLYDDFNYGTYPGTVQHVGAGNVAATATSFYELTRTGGYLAGATIPVTYQILAADTAATRKQKGFQWMIDNQLAVIMPNATPTPNATNYAYWEAYLDYVIQPHTLTVAQRANYANYAGNVPTNQNAYTIADGGNSNINGFYNKLGYQSYVQFMMDYGRDKNVTGALRSPLSAASPECPYHTDTDPASPGYGYSFPPREQPTHAARLAIMAALDNIALRNNGIGEALKDHVAIIAYDTANEVVVKFPLDVATCNYAAVKGSCPNLQAVSDSGASTATENGLILAKNHLDPNLNPTGARVGADKVVVLLTDGVANIKASSNATIDSYVSNYNATHNPDGEWFNSNQGSYRERNASMMQVDIMHNRGWRVYSVGIGLDADVDFMNRMSRLAGTGVVDPNNPNGPKISPQAEGNPANYQQRLTNIFNEIILQGNGQLVK